MAQYSYKAMNPAGRIRRGSIAAANVADLEARLKRLGLDLIVGTPLRQGKSRGRRLPRRTLIHFCFQLGQLIRAGIPVIEGLADLRDTVATYRFREILTAMIESIEGGKSLSQAMAEHPSAFDEIFVGLVRAGEQTGRLPEMLSSLNETLRWQDELAAHTRRLALYPAFLGVLVFAAFLFVMIYLVPKLAGFVSAMGQQLPLHTRLLIATSGFVGRHWYALIAGPVIALTALPLAVANSPHLRRQWDSAKLRIPIIGSVLRKIALSRFASVFAMLYSSGIDVLSALRSTQAAVGNSAIKEGLHRAGQHMVEGQSVTSAFQKVNLFPPLVVRMLHVGENTGALDTALDNIAYFYSRDVKESVERLQTLIEPVLTVIVGLFLGWVMLAVLGPIYDTVAKIRI